MNERIKELALQATNHVTATVPFNDPDYAELAKLFASQDNTVINAFKEKFAELIVKECASFINEFDVNNGDVRTGDDLLKHFGVEE